MFNHHFIHNDQQNSSPSNSKVRVTDKNNKSFTNMPNDHLKSEIARRAMAVVAAYEELGSACRKAEYCVSQLKASSNTTTAGINDDNMVASLLMSLTNASWERNTNSVENDKTVNDLSVVTNSPTSSNSGAVMGSCDGLISSPASPYSTQFTPEEILFLDEFNKLYEKRVQLGPTRQSDIASEIRQCANNSIAFGQPAVSGLVRKTKVPKEQKAVDALKAWIECGKKRLGVV
ncbi:43221_t:CDS:2 [Gigaspora margarita]|uniref:43221_t:CDS:1 n=1 Tax=Gigaspora margarita TaxID=4874 RepID=A0ABN7UGY8_GIGMA|nr:43221_t:CDS:2 [Gigaspora margarita]